MANQARLNARAQINPLAKGALTAFEKGSTGNFEANAMSQTKEANDNQESTKPDPRSAGRNMASRIPNFTAANNNAPNSPTAVEVKEPLPEVQTSVQNQEKKGVSDSKDPTKKVDTEKTIKRGPADGTSLPHVATKEKPAPTLEQTATNKAKEEKEARDAKAREESLQGQRAPVQLDLFKDNANLNVSDEFAENFNNLDKVKDKNEESENGSTKGNSTQTEEPENSGQNINNNTEQYELSLNIPQGYDTDRINKIRSELLSKMNINLSVSDTVRLIKMNLKVTSGISMFVVIASDFTVEITGLLMSAFFAVVGLGTNAIPIPFLNFLVGGTVSAIGFSVGIATFLLSTILSIFFIYIVSHYQRTCCEIFEIAEIRKAAHDRYIWLWALGYMIPFIGNFGQLFRAIIEPIRKDRFVKKISKIVSTK